MKGSRGCGHGRRLITIKRKERKTSATRSQMRKCRSLPDAIELYV